MFQGDRLTTMHIRRHKRMQTKILDEKTKQMEDQDIQKTNVSYSIELSNMFGNFCLTFF
jgi:uncharacterized protein (UPF0218 family)